MNNEIHITSIKKFILKINYFSISLRLNPIFILNYNLDEEINISLGIFVKNCFS